MPRHLPFAQGVLVEAGDALITLGKCDEFVAADDIVDARERLVSGTENYFAQNGVGRVLLVLGHFPFYFTKRISSQYDVIQAHFPSCEAGPHHPLGDCASAHALAPRDCGHDAPSSTTDGGEYLVCAKTKLKSGIPIEFKFILETTAQPFRLHGNLITGNKSKTPALAQLTKWLDQCSGCTFGGLECRR